MEKSYFVFVSCAPSSTFMARNLSAIVLQSDIASLKIIYFQLLKQSGNFGCSLVHVILVQLMGKVNNSLLGNRLVSPTVQAKCFPTSLSNTCCFFPLSILVSYCKIVHSV